MSEDIDHITRRIFEVALAVLRAENRSDTHRMELLFEHPKADSSIGTFGAGWSCWLIYAGHHLHDPMKGRGSTVGESACDLLRLLVERARGPTTESLRQREGEHKRIALAADREARSLDKVCDSAAALLPKAK